MPSGDSSKPCEPLGLLERLAAGCLDDGQGPLRPDRFALQGCARRAGLQDDGAHGSLDDVTQLTHGLVTTG